MKCEYCEESFEVIRKGSGGTNRALCYICLPKGLNKKERSERRASLLVLKAREEKLSLGCASCGYNKNASALEWHHHLDDKLTHPSNALKRGWKAYKMETETCVLLCANCHRELHYPESNK